MVAAAEGAEVAVTVVVPVADVVDVGGPCLASSAVFPPCAGVVVSFEYGWPDAGVPVCWQLGFAVAACPLAWHYGFLLSPGQKPFTS